MLNDTILRLLELLLSHEEGVSAATVLGTLAINRRMLYYNLEKLNEALADNGFPQAVSKEGSLHLDVSRKGEIREVFRALCRTDYILSPRERQLLICLHIGLSPRPVTLEILTDVLVVSRNTVLSEVGGVKRMLERQGLRLQARPRAGYVIMGGEAQARRFLMDCFTKLDSSCIREVVRETVLGFVAEQKDAGETGRLPEDIGSLVQSAGQCGSYNTKTVGDITWYLLISWLRGQRHLAYIPTQELEDLPELEAARHICRGLEALGLELPAQELGFVAAVLLGSKVMALPRQAVTGDEVYLQFERDLTTAFEQTALVRLEDHKELVNNLFLHVRPMFYRIKYHIWADNSHSDSIMEKYYPFFVLTRLAVGELEERYGFQVGEDEVAYLCIYFGSLLREQFQAAGPWDAGTYRILIVCGAGICTSILLRQQLTALLGGGCRYEITGEQSVTPGVEDRYDLIVSTVELPLEDNRFVRVSPILTGGQREQILKWSLSGKMQRSESVRLNDILRIVEQSAEIKNREELVNDLLLYLNADPEQPVEFHLQDVFFPGFIQYSRGEATPQEAMALSCAPLVDAGLIGAGYSDSILTTIEDLGLYAEYHEGFLLAHAKPEPDNHGVGIGVTVFEQPVVFSRWERAIQVFVVLATVDNFSHVYALQELLNVLAKPEERERILGWRGECPEALYQQMLAAAGLNK